MFEASTLSLFYQIEAGSNTYIQDHRVLEPSSWNMLSGNLFVYRYFFSSSFRLSHSNTAASNNCVFVHICVCMDCGWWVQFIFDMFTFCTGWIPPFRTKDDATISLCEESRKISTTFRLVHTDRTSSSCCITHYCNAMSKQDYLPLSSGSPAVFLSKALGAPTSSHPVIGRSLLAGSALLFSPVPVEYQPVKQQNRQSVFAVMVNEVDDSECENVLMTPLREALPLNLDEALSIRSLLSLPTAFAGFPKMLMGGFHLCDDMKLCCQGHRVQCAARTLVWWDFQTQLGFKVPPFRAWQWPCGRWKNKSLVWN